MRNREPKAAATVEELQEMIQKREVAIDLLSDGPVKSRLTAQLAELRKQEAPEQRP